MKKTYYVYIVSNKYDKVLYIGVTNDLERRMWEHKYSSVENSFSKKYRLSKLLYYEDYYNIDQAIHREKQLKNWRRQWKINQIKTINPNFNDLSSEWDCFTSDQHK
jgi:putative endonuclease